MDEHYVNTSAAPGTGTGTTIRGSSVSEQPAPPQLSCALCRDRKLKCDKLDPCTNCSSSGVICVPVYRRRLPRGRHAHKNKPWNSSPPPPPSSLGNSNSVPASNVTSPAQTDCLNERIRRLESLLLEAGSTTAGVGHNAAKASEESRELSVGGLDTQSTFTRRSSLAARRSNSYSNNSVEERLRLPGVMELAPGDYANGASSNSVQVDPVDGGITVLGLFGMNNNQVEPSFPPRQVGLFSQNKAAAAQLCQVYLQNVDPIVKILHRPSLSRWMIQGERYLSYPEGHATVEALGAAVCYAAANTMTESRCQAVFHDTKSSVVAACRRPCEAAIANSGLLLTRDLTVLQAFILYLIGKRTEDKSTAVWTLLALAVRIAKGLGLHGDPDEDTGPSEISFFEQQMRKRLWFTICLMDFQASLAQKSEPLVSHEEAGSFLACVQHVNDADFDLTTTTAVGDREGLTDTTFALITYRVQLVGRLLNFAVFDATNNGGGSTSSTCSVASPPSTIISTDQDRRQQHVRRFEQQALSLLHFCDPESSPYAWFTWHSTQCFVAAVRFSALHERQHAPELRLLGSQSPSPPEIGGKGDPELLRRALHHLEKVQLMRTDPRGEGYRWYVTIPQTALATAIGECNACADATLIRRAWPLLETLYQHHESAVASRQSGGCIGNDPFQDSESLTQLMHQTREKLAMLVQGLVRGGDQEVSGGQNALRTARAPLSAPLPTPTMGGAISGEIPNELTSAPNTSPISSGMDFETSYAASIQLLSQQMEWDPVSFSL